MQEAGGVHSRDPHLRTPWPDPRRDKEPNVTKTMIAMSAVVVSLSASLPLAAEDYCAHKAARSAGLEVSGATRIEIVARAGSLRVTGRAGAARLEASGTACASDAKLLDQVQIKASRQGATLRVEAQVPEAGWGLTGGAGLDLVVDVPDALPLQVSDSSGPLEIRSVAALQLEDSSGEILVEDVRGDLRVQDSSGEMTLAKIEGDVRIHDSSGEIEVKSVGGSVDVEQDSSGGIRIAQVGGSVHVAEDSSGPIDVRDVGGDFSVGRDGSGGIRHSGVKGSVSLPKGK